jgi:hypothetical protein
LDRVDFCQLLRRFHFDDAEFAARIFKREIVPEAVSVARFNGSQYEAK